MKTQPELVAVKNRRGWQWQLVNALNGELIAVSARDYSTASNARKAFHTTVRAVRRARTK